jgi:hypothetical protein
LGINTRVGVLGEAVTLANLDLDFIVTSSVVRVACKGHRNRVLTGGLSEGYFSITFNTVRNSGEEGDETVPKGSASPGGMTATEISPGPVALRTV